MEFFNPVKLILGRGVRSGIHEDCVGKNVLIICTSSALNRYKSDLALNPLFENKDIKFEHGFESNPSLNDLVKISHKYHDKSIDLVIGLGGGSAMDVAKIACVSIPALANGIELNQLLEDSDLCNSFEAISCIQVPTTAGTGSEVTPFATVWDYDTQKKKSLSNTVMFAEKAYIDPDFLRLIPYNVAVSTGLDALNQAFESIWNVNATDISKFYALKAAELCLEFLPLLHKSSSEPHIRSALAQASLYAGIGISQTRTSICHSISYALTLRFGLNHGLACAFSMKEVFKFNQSHIKKELISLERNIGINPYLALKKVFDALEIESAIKTTISEPNNIVDMIDEMKTAGRFENNIRVCDPSDLSSIVNKSVARLN
jgi:alcohol dehydrogenase